MFFKQAVFTIDNVYWIFPFVFCMVTLIECIICRGYTIQTENSMKIACPNCSASGDIPVHEIPLEGRYLTCPRCNHGFTVMKPPPEADDYLVETCPACYFSSFGMEQFGTCPKCGVVVKTFIERQRAEKQMIKEQELLGNRFLREEPPVSEQETVSPVEGFMDSLHPVNLVGWGCGLAALIILALGLMGLLDYDTGLLKTQLSAQRDEQVSSWYVFIHFGLLPWLKTLYGLVVLGTVFFFQQHKAISIKVLSFLLRMLLGFVPLYLVVCFVGWVMQPIPHSIVGYFVEIINIIFMTALFGIPLFILDRFLRDKRIVSIVNL